VATANIAPLWLPTRVVETWRELEQVLRHQHPQLVIINLPDVDATTRRTSDSYLDAIVRADSIVEALWRMLQADSV
jgi:hypothetical protein